ncbi:MAG: hypothetical protein U0805_15120 [Pirellulales bacterium]
MESNRSFGQFVTDPVVLTELFAIGNLSFLAVDIYVAHSMNQFEHWAEWIPLTFSCLAPVLLIGAIAVARSLRPAVPRPDMRMTAAQKLSRDMGMAVGFASVAVGVAGLVWHLNSQFFAEQTLKNLVFAAPFVAPLAYSGIGFLLLLNRMVPAESADWPRWVILLALGGWVGNFVLSLADHAQNSFFYWPEWVPVIASAVAIGALVAAFADYRNRGFLLLCMLLMVVEIGVGIAGWLLHLRAVSESSMESLWDKVVYSAPAFAPMLFADLAILALVGLATLAHRSAPKSWERIGFAPTA